MSAYTAMSPYMAFARRFFAALDAPVREEAGRLHVTLSGEAAAFFGREAWTLTDRPHDGGGELLAYGSEAFERMLAFLEARGRLTAGRLVEREGPPAALALANGELREVDARRADRALFVFNYHLSFLSDERAEQLFSVCVDAEGRLAAAPALEGAEITGWPAAPDAPFAASDAADGLAIAEGERIADALEAEIESRLARIAGRLKAFYEAQIEELPLRRKRGQSEDAAYDALLTERSLLRRELERKLADEQARHRLRVHVRLVSRAVVAVPGRERTFRLATPHAERGLVAWEDRHAGVLTLAPCERCGAALESELALCAEGHLICAACLGRCGACGRETCASELADCAACQAPTCARCLATCATGHAVCRSHLAGCGCCGQAFCDTCLVSCPGCAPETRLASAHGEPCAVCARAVCSAHRVACPHCGGTVCGTDRAECPGCGDVGCVSHMGACRHCELDYCTRCRDAGEPTGGEPVCRACGVVGDGIEAPYAWLASIEKDATAARYGRWRGIENERYRYLLGRGLLGDLLVVTDHAGAVVKIKEIGLWAKLFGWSH